MAFVGFPRKLSVGNGVTTYEVNGRLLAMSMFVTRERGQGVGFTVDPLMRREET